MPERERDVNTEDRTQALLSVLSIASLSLDRLPAEEEVLALERPPSTLCHFCQKVVNKFNTEDYSGYVDHYDSLPALKTSAENGCGLCAQMVFALGDPTLSKPFDQARPPFESRIYPVPLGDRDVNWEVRRWGKPNLHNPNRPLFEVAVRRSLTPSKCCILSWRISISKYLAHFVILFRFAIRNWMESSTESTRKHQGFLAIMPVLVKGMFRIAWALQKISEAVETHPPHIPKGRRAKDKALFRAGCIYQICNVESLLGTPQIYEAAQR
jgi:hypothetical protein